MNGCDGNLWYIGALLLLPDFVTILFLLIILVIIFFFSYKFPVDRWAKILFPCKYKVNICIGKIQKISGFATYILHTILLSPLTL